MTLDRLQPHLVAILRGLALEEAADVGRLLFDGGWRMLEVPLNRPHALRCIEVLAAIAPSDALVGGGTMLSASDVDDVHAAGGRLMVAPNCDPQAIERALSLGMLCAPGVATPTEALHALRLGAHALKLFPAEMIGPGGLAAMASILPAGTALWPVGGITADSLPTWLRAGATGFGIGSQLYRPGQDLDTLDRASQRFMSAWQEARSAT